MPAAPTPGDRLQALADQYATYRENAKPRERVPDALRAATLDLIDSGISPGVVVAACRVQRPQLALWRRRRSGRGDREPRILQVVEAPATGSSVRVTIESKRIVIELPL